MSFDVIVVGAGPAGSSTAYFLARRGRRVLLLDRNSFPRDKSCGDGLTLPALRILDEMNVLDRLQDAQRVAGARVFMRGKASRDFLYPAGKTNPDYGLVVPRHRLDAAICARAVEAGAVLWEHTLVKRLIRRKGRVVGVEVNRENQALALRAPLVVAADGAASRLAAQAGLTTGESPPLGIALRGYFDGIRDLPGLLEIYMPLTDPTDRYILPSYGWVFPTGPGSANVGVGLFERTGSDTVRFEDRDASTAAESGNRPANWGNMLALITGDLFLSKAYELSAGCGHLVSEMIADSLGVVCEARIRGERAAAGSPGSEELYEDLAARQVASLFELPCWLGAVLGGLDDGAVTSLRSYGINVGLAFQLTDQVLQLFGRASQLGLVLSGASSVGIYSRPLRYAFRHWEPDELRTLLRTANGQGPIPRAVLDAVERSGAIDQCMAAARDYAGRAVESISILPEGPTRRTLTRLAGYAVDRDAGVAPDLESLIE